MRFELPVDAGLWLSVADDQPPTRCKSLKEALDDLLCGRGVEIDRHIPADNQVKRARPGCYRWVARLDKIEPREADRLANRRCDSPAVALLLEEACAQRCGCLAKRPFAV